MEGLGYRVIGLNVDALDWRFSKSSDVVANVVSRLDALNLGPAGRESVIGTISDTTSVSLGAVQGIIDAARARGYRFVPLEYCLYTLNCTTCPAGVDVFKSGLPGLNYRCYEVRA